MKLTRGNYFLFLAGLVSTCALAIAQPAPTYRPSPGSQPPVYQPRTAPPVTPTGKPVMSPGAQASCRSLKEMLNVVRRGRMTPGGELLPAAGAAAFSSPGAKSCSAKAGIAAGSSQASCVYEASNKADAELKRTQLIAHTRDCLEGWPNGGTSSSFMFQSPDRLVSGTVQVQEDAGKFSVTRSGYYDVVKNPVVQDDNCGTVSAMSSAVAGGFPASTVHKLTSGTQQLNTPVGHANMCYAFPRTMAGGSAGLSCTWIIEDKDTNGPGKEVLARGFNRRFVELMSICRTGQIAQPAQALGNGELASSTTSDGRESWSVKLLGPDKGAPWAVMVTLKAK